MILQDFKTIKYVEMAGVEPASEEIHIELLHV